MRFLKTKDGDDMQKEKLTAEKIRLDLKRMLRHIYAELIELFFIDVVIIAVLFLIPVFFYKLVFGFFAAVFLCLVRVVRIIRTRLKALYYGAFHPFFFDGRQPICRKEEQKSPQIRRL